MFAALTLPLLLTAALQQGPTVRIRVLPESGVRLVDERTLDPVSGRFRRATTIAGLAVDAGPLLRDEAAARDARTGKLWGELPDRLRAGSAVPVVFWLERPDDQPDLRRVIDIAIDGGMSSEDARRHALDVAATHCARSTEPFVAALQRAGHEVEYVDGVVPLVFARLDEIDVRHFARRDDVDQVYYASQQWLPEGTRGAALPNEWASPSARTDFVHRRGVTGRDVKVLVNGLGATAPDNPYLPPIVSGNPTFPVVAHTTFVSGVIASRHPRFGGAAPGLTVLYDYAGWGDVAAPQAWAWGMAQGIAFGNCSWWTGQEGSIEFLDRYFDYVIRNFAVMMFKSGGNRGNGNPTTTPGNGFNSIATGNADDADTHDWEDDAVYFTSSTANPAPGHEKPELVAHGHDVTSTGVAAPWTQSSQSGSSYASPVTCGTAALLAEEEPSLLTKPEAVKALLLAGAWNDIAPGRDFDGVGGVDAAASWRAARDRQFHTTTLTAASFSNGLYEVPIPLDQGDETRVAAVWFSSADSSYATDNLLMDLDLVVLDPSGNVVASSASAIDPFEAVQFVPNLSGVHTVRMQNQSFQGANEPFALAWTTARDASVAEVTFAGGGSQGSTLRIDWRDPYHPGDDFVGLLSLTGYPATTPLGNDRVLPIGFDGLAQATLAQPGFHGVLDGKGRASTSFVVPPIPALTIHAAMFTFREMPARVVETSDVTSKRIGG